MPISQSRYADPEKLAKAPDATKLVLNSYWRSRDNLVEQKQEQWEEGYDAWRSSVEIADDDIKTKLVIPLIFSNIESVISRLATIRPAVEVWGRGEEDKTRADAHRALIEHNWDAMDMHLKIADFVKSALIYGTAFMKVVHRKKVETRLVKEVVAPEVQLDLFGSPIPAPENPEFTFRAKKVETWNGPWADVCDIDSIFPDPDGKSDIDSLGYIIQRIKGVPLHELKSARRNDKPLYQNLEKLEELSKAGNQRRASQSKQDLRDRTRELFDNASVPPPDPHKREFTLLEYWTDSQIITIVEEFPELAPIRNDYNECGTKPFILFTPIPDPNNIYGLSVPEVLFALQLELSTIHSARVDNLMFNVHQMWMLQAGSGLDPRNIKFRPGGHIWVKDMNDIQPLPRQATDFSLYRETDEIRRWAQNVGITDTFAGVRSNLTGNTATEATILAEASGSKVAFMFARLGEQALTRLGRLLIKINEIYVDSARMVRIIGDEFTETEFTSVSPEDLLSTNGVDLDVRIDIGQSEPETKAMKLQRAERGLGVLAQLGMPLTHPVMRVYLAEFLRATGIRNPERFIETEEAQQAALAALGPEGAAQAGNTGPQGDGGVPQEIAAALGAALGG